MTLTSTGPARAGRLAALALILLGLPAAALAANETERVDRTVKMAPGGTLTLKSFSGKVEITGSDRQDVVIQAVRRAPRERLDRIKLDIQSDGTNVTIEANKRTGPREDKDNVVETDFVIQMPAKANLDVNVFSAPVTITGVTGSHKVKSFSSDLRLSVNGPVDAETFSGAISLRPSAWTAGQQVRAKTFSGDIEMTVPASAAGEVEFDSFSGDLDAEVPLQLRSKSKRNVSATLNAGAGGGGNLSFKTFSGDVRLRK